MKHTVLLFSLILVTFFFTQNEIYPQWNHTGPEGGEVRALCVSGTNLFAAAWSGGIYRSTNNGTSWTAVNNGLTEINLNVSALFADGTNIFAGTWGNGVFLSTNYGDSWVEVNSSSTASTAVHAFIRSGTSLFMGSQGGGVHRTTDNGASWEQMNNGLLGLDVRDLAVIDTIIFAATWGGNKVFRSTDDGASWTQASNGITFVLDDPCLNVRDSTIFLGTYLHGVYRSTNNGDDWIEVNNGIPANANVRDFAIGGSNIYAATRGGGVFLSTDNGTNWNSINTGLTDNRVESIIFTANQYLFAGTMRNGIFLSTNNGTNWTAVNSGFNAKIVYAYTTIGNGTGGHNLLAGTGAGVYQSTDNGLTWSFLGLSYQSVYGIAVVGTDIFAGAMGGGVFRSTDGGVSWAASGLPNAMIWTLYSNGTDIFVGLGFFGGAYRSTDNGNTWTSVPGLEYKWVMSFTENENYMFASAMFGGAFRSSDNGNSFSPINNGLLDNRVSTLAVMGDSTLFAGIGDANGLSGAGVYRSEDSGNSWTQVNNGLPSNLIVWSFAVMGNNIFASSSSSGQNKIADVYLSTDRGENWLSVSTGLISNYIQALFIDDTNILAGTIGSSTWWRPLSEMILMLPSQPTNLIAVADTFSVALSWTDNSDNETGFKIERKDDSLQIAAPWILIDSVGANVTSYIDTGLNPNSPYSYRMYAFNTTGNSAYSDSVGIVTIVPVELTSFIASVEKNGVTLNWQTATETNNQGFEIERKAANNNYEKIGFVAGFGTTTELKSYSFSDENVTTGKYNYRLKQIDFDGTFEYSNAIEVEVDLTPTKFALDQNYPNPFNPRTTIKYSIPSSEFVSIKVYDVIGNEIANLVDVKQEAGNYEVSFDASTLSSGIYLYKIQAGSFVQTKKMILMK